MKTLADISKYTFKHVMDIQIRYNDVDVNGHVNNAVYHDYFNVGRMDYFNKNLWAKNVTVFDNQIFTKNMIIAQSDTSYLKPVFMGDKIQIKSAVIRMGKSSLEMVQILTRGEEVVTINDTTFVSINPEGKPSPIPDDWKQALGEFEGLPFLGN